MCDPNCLQMIDASISRRSFLKMAAVNVAMTTSFMATPLNAKEELIRPFEITVNKVVDLTHTLTPDFPTMSSTNQLSIQEVASLSRDGYNSHGYRLTSEHTGTHLDAPFHFSDKTTADKIPIENLVGPLVIVDITDKASANADAMVTETDLIAWERKNGHIPFGAIVAMRSGWDAYVTSPKFRNVDSQGIKRFPGFGPDAADWLMKNRQVKGIMVDTLSLDHGSSKDFEVHFSWLPSNRWGMECVANLGVLPARGAVVIVGGPKILGATGGPSRVIALL